ncbi:MAG: STAS domain-containing protein [Actinomycetota bacterium]
MAFEAGARTNGTVAVLALIGELNAAADDELNDAYETAISANPKTVLLNFDGVSYINSTGIALIVGLLAEARKSDRKIMACGLTDHYKEIFEITRIADFVSIFADEQEAVGAASA